MTTGAVPSYTDALFDDVSEAELRRRHGVKWQVDPDVLPAWVADMDFRVPTPVTDAIEAAVRRGDLGYPSWPDGNPLRAAFATRMRDIYGWETSATQVREHTDLIQGLQLLLHLGTSPGDAVAIMTPTYPPFLTSLTATGRRTVASPFRETATGWDPDLPGLADAVARSDCRALVLVNPHNPTGRALTRDELTGIAEIARRHDLLVISDEIHAELVHAPHEHIPFASISADATARTVTLTSAGKAFNLAGLRCSVAHFGPERLLAARDGQPPDLYGTVSTLGVLGSLAAWQQGAPWQERLMRVLDRNRRRVADAVALWSAGAPDPMPEATYLYWFDAAHLGLADHNDPVAAVLDRARVLLDGGQRFGSDGRRRLRLNFATSSRLLDEIISRLGKLAVG